MLTRGVAKILVLSDLHLSHRSFSVVVDGKRLAESLQARIPEQLFDRRASNAGWSFIGNWRPFALDHCQLTVTNAERLRAHPTPCQPTFWSRIPIRGNLYVAQGRKQESLSGF